jgi:hypothetical protein
MSFGTVQAEKMTTESGYSLGAGNASSFKNRFINGNMAISQRGTTFTNPGSGDYTLDRYQYRSTNPSQTLTVIQNAGSVTPPAGFSYYLGCTMTSAYTPTSTDRFAIGQCIEGFNMSDFGWGTANAKAVTFSFWAYSSLTGTFGGAIKNSVEDYAYPFSFTMNSANTWEFKTVAITGPTAGTWVGATNGIGARIYWSLGAGATRQATAGTWAAGDYWSATGAVNICATNGATFYVTGAQFEVGTVATSFDFRSYGTELALCQRYCYAQNKLVTNNYYAFGSAFATGATTGQLGTPYPVSMRSNPSATYSAANLFFVDSAVSTSAGFTSIVADQVGNNYAYSSYGGGTGSTAGYSGRWLSNGSSAAFVIWSAEL